GKTAQPNPAIAGQPLTYTITITNAGPSTATSVKITDTLPASVQFASGHTSDAGNCAGTTTIVCSFGSPVPLAGVATATIVVTPTAAGTLTNTATVGAAETDLNGGNNSVTQVMSAVQQADLLVVKTASAASVPAGQRLTYTIAVTNSGPS